MTGWLPFSASSLWYSPCLLRISIVFLPSLFTGNVILRSVLGGNIWYNICLAEKAAQMLAPLHPLALSAYLIFISQRRKGKPFFKALYRRNSIRHRHEAQTGVELDGFAVQGRKEDVQREQGRGHRV